MDKIKTRFGKRILFTALFTLLLFSAMAYAAVFHNANEVNVQFNGQIVTAQYAFTSIWNTIEERGTVLYNQCRIDQIPQLQEDSELTTIVSTVPGGHPASQIIVSFGSKKITADKALAQLNAATSIILSPHTPCADKCQSNTVLQTGGVCNGAGQCSYTTTRTCEARTVCENNAIVAYTGTCANSACQSTSTACEFGCENSANGPICRTEPAQTQIPPAVGTNPQEGCYTQDGFFVSNGQTITGYNEHPYLFNVGWCEYSYISTCSNGNWDSIQPYYDCYDQ